jgi:hypothetical protein
MAFVAMIDSPAPQSDRPLPSRSPRQHDLDGQVSAAERAARWPDRPRTFSSASPGRAIGAVGVRPRPAQATVSKPCSSMWMDRRRLQAGMLWTGVWYSPSTMTSARQILFDILYGSCSAQTSGPRSGCS